METPVFSGQAIPNNITIQIAQPYQNPQLAVTITCQESTMRNSGDKGLHPSVEATNHEELSNHLLGRLILFISIPVLLTFSSPED